MTGRTVSDWIRTHALRECGITDTFTREQIERHVDERLSGALELIRARVGVGFIRYESNRGRAPDYLAWLYQSLDKYETTGNLDALLDIAFYAIAEFKNPSSEGTFYEPCAEVRREL